MRWRRYILERERRIAVATRFCCENLLRDVGLGALPAAQASLLLLPGPRRFPHRWLSEKPPCESSKRRSLPCEIRPASSSAPPFHEERRIARRSLRNSELAEGARHPRQSGHPVSPHRSPDHRKVNHSN